MRNWRLPLLVATVIFGATAAASAAETQIERGKVSCDNCRLRHCHTPGDLLGKPDLTRILAGSEVGFGISGVGVFVGGNLTRTRKRASATGRPSRSSPPSPKARRRMAASCSRSCPGRTSPSVGGRRPGDRRLSEEPSADQDRGPGTVRAQGVPSTFVSVVIPGDAYAKMQAPKPAGRRLRSTPRRRTRRPGQAHRRRRL